LVGIKEFSLVTNAVVKTGKILRTKFCQILFGSTNVLGKKL